MEVIGFIILLFTPTLGRLHWIAGLVSIVAGVLVMILTSNDSVGSLGMAGLACIGSGFTHKKITGEIVITDIFTYVAGILLIILAFVAVNV
ncbi:MAG: hypothetical protein J6U85_02590 [Bacteroidales bacterium]|nr:hypothetical protein [Bacteroidales bacterium]